MRIALDLLPENQKIVRLPVWLWIIAVVMLVTAVMHTVYVVYHLSDPKEIYEKKISEINEQIKIDKKNMPPANSVSSATRKARFINFLISEGRINFYSILKSLEESIEPGSYIDEFILEGKAVLVKGTAGNMDEIYAFNKNLLKSGVFTDIKMSHSMEDDTFRYTFRMKIINGQ
jgi:formaldehyde-activating enzyme involved in methanogenesis